MSPLVVAATLLCGGLAATVRYLVTLWFGDAERFPWAVLAVNVVGSALGGAVLGLGAGLDDGIRLILLAGVGGGLTTFSTLSLETVQLAMARRWRTALLSVGGNLVLGLAAASLAYLSFAPLSTR